MDALTASMLGLCTVGIKHIPIVCRSKLPKACESDCTYTNLHCNGPSPYRYRITLDGRVHDTGAVPSMRCECGSVVYWGPFNEDGQRIRVEIVTELDRMILLVDSVHLYEERRYWTKVACLVVKDGRTDTSVGCSVEIWRE